MPSRPLSSPSSLDSALARIAYLEQQLNVAKRVVRDRTGADLEEWLESAGQEAGEAKGAAGSPSFADEAKLGGLPSFASNGVSDLGERPLGVVPPSGPVITAKETPTKEQEDGAKEEEEEPLDISPLVLRAIQLRKDLHRGKVEEEKGEEELGAILQAGGGKMSEEQEETVRRWAGL
ncbi:hypothetical protein JCM11251_000633 [Rhodosporidiobolus azoricus]